jgi:hypothetical protein
MSDETMSDAAESDSRNVDKQLLASSCKSGWKSGQNRTRKSS